MPNPNMAKAVASYAGSMNIGEHLLRSPAYARRGPLHKQIHEIQRPNMCERFGSAARLKAGSQPIGARESVVTTDDGTVCVFGFATSCNRSPLWV
jgi:hypothetical protein